MNIKSWRYWAYFFNIYGSIQFIVLTTIAMFFYNGGTYIDPSTTHYIFWYNYFSDLGRLIAHSGLINIISFVLFTITLSIWGFSQIIFFIAFPNFFKNSKITKFLSSTASMLGIFSGVCFIGIALTPVDLYHFMHDFFVLLGFASIFFSISLYSIIIFKNRNFTNFYAFSFLIAAFILGSYYIILFFIPYRGNLIELFIYVVGQKLIIYSLLICGIIQGFGALKQFHK
ncbi:MAG: hypothetical protein ACFFEY_17250 [Candidatus Thorarchaeota archaeon]